jgi:hypothetical protein
MTERDPFEERLARYLAAIAQSRFTAVDPLATADAAIAAQPPPGRRGVRLIAGALVTAVAIGVGFSVTSLLPSPPGASTTPSPSPVQVWGHIRWERAPNDPGAGHDQELNQWMGGVVAGGPGYVAWGLDEKRLPDGIGASMAMWVSQDALTWREVIYEPGETLSYRMSVVEIAAGPQGLVASGGVCCTEVRAGFWLTTPARWFSRDGEQWTRVESVGLQPDPERVMGVVAGPGGFVEVGAANAQPTVWFSPDGTTWTAISLGVGGFSSGVVNDITTDAQGYVAVGEVSNTKQGIANDQGRAMVWRSTNGVDWVRVGEDDPVLPIGPIYRLERVVAYPGGLFVIGTRALPLEEQTCYPAPSDHLGPWRPSCVTSERVHLHSPDGERWTDLPIGELKEGELSFFPARVITGDDTGLMVVASAYQPDTEWPAPSLWTSPDGVHWTRGVEQPPLAPRDQVNAFVVVGDRIVAVGQINNSAAVWIGTRVRASVDPKATEAPLSNPA